MINPVVYYHLIGPAWSRAFRCIWMLEELGVPYELHETMPQARGVRKFNQAGKVPVLIETFSSNKNLKEISSDDADSTFALSESVAINTYLGDKFYLHSNGGNDDNTDAWLVPKPGTRERALYDQTVLFILSELDSQALWTYRKHTAMGRFFGHVPEIEKPCHDHFEKMNMLMAHQLKSHGSTESANCYLLGSQFTAADILYVHCLDWAKSYGWNKNYSEHLLAYLDRCHQRPAYIRAKDIRKASNANLEKYQSQVDDGTGKQTQPRPTPTSQL
ncbi:hypothetical protein ACA910_015994 [Epithemia clementina (nom. ined.)]